MKNTLASSCTSQINRARRCLYGLGWLMWCCGLPLNQAWGSGIVHVSTDQHGEEGNNGSGSPAITPNGRYVIFTSYASNLVADDSNNSSDIFRKDVKTGAVILVSTDALGAQTNGDSKQPAITSDGRYVVFISSASNLVSDDTNDSADVFLKDIETGAVMRVSTDALGREGNSSSVNPTITPNGRYVVFGSYASNLVADDSNDSADIFRKDLKTGIVTRVSTDASGIQGNAQSAVDPAPSITQNGRYVVFSSYASNLVAGDNNDSADVFRKDLKTGEIRLVSSSDRGGQGGADSIEPSVSADGRFVVFSSLAYNLVTYHLYKNIGIKDIFRKDIKTGNVLLVSANAQNEEGNHSGWAPSMSSNGRFVTFISYADNLVEDDSNDQADVFRKDLKTGSVKRISTDAFGTESNGHSTQAVITPNGRYVAFSSIGSNLINGVSTVGEEVFRYDAKGHP